MKYVIHLLICVAVCSCSSIMLPEEGIVKKAGKTYMQEQPTFLGLRVGKPRYKEIPSKADKLRAQLQKPALWTLGICLPLGIVFGAVMVVGVSSPLLMKWAGSLSGVCLASAVGAGAWLAATTYLIIAIPLIAVGLIYAYRKSKGKRIGFKEIGNGTSN